MTPRRLQRTMTGIAFLLTALAAGAAAAEQQAPGRIIGRWDLTIHGPDGDYPSWLEVRLSGRTTLVGAFVGRLGSVRPISRVEFDGSRIKFTMPPQWERRNDDQVFEGGFDGGNLRGTTTDDAGRRVTWTAKPAPALKRDRPPTWGAPIELFNGRDFAGWKSRPPAAKHGWVVRDGLLANDTPGIDILTEQKFTDFQLHTEFRYPAGSNSGVFLRGRYEVQIEDNFGQEPEAHQLGSIYGFLTPRVNAAKRPGEWQTLDVTLAGRVVTVALNGETIIDRQTIPGITGGALDSDEGAPGPIMVQGDHGKIEFRKLTLTPGS